MAKFDAVDRLMSLATGAKTPAKGRTVPSVVAEDRLEAQVSTSERGVPVSTTPGIEPGTTTPVQPQVSAGDRGRQLIGAIRPFLPAVGGALRLVDHGAAQTIARLLPILGSFGSSTPNTAGSPPVGTGSATQGGGEPQSLEALLLGLNQRQVTVTEEMKALGESSSQQGEQLRRIRESQERLSAEQGSLSHLVYQLRDRSRLLTAGIVILLMLVIGQATLMVLFFHRQG